MQTACPLSFNIATWGTVSSRVTSAEQWQQWVARRPDAEDPPEYKSALSSLPAIRYRHLGASARLICGAAWELANAYPNYLPVYVSHDGGTNCSFKLRPELLCSGAVSPTSPGLSVHNAQARQ